MNFIIFIETTCPISMDLIDFGQGEIKRRKEAFDSNGKKEEAKER